ncbi:MAG: polyphenol oxidase family protein [Verrucomicrobiales bacterium]|nr:polyphenol oxidase family protein [Verrucomicrobiales bacterium]
MSETNQQGTLSEPTLLDRSVEFFHSLNSIPGLVHGFILRNPAIDVVVDREVALARLQPHYDSVLGELKIEPDHFWTGEQVHGSNVEFCDPKTGPARHFPDTDGLVTAAKGEFLGIFVADCGAVFLVDPKKQVCGLVHSGKNGTEQQIAVRAIERMREEFGSDPADLIVQLAPCIRPPAYEVDFAVQIVADCIEAGVPEGQMHDCGTCTSLDLERYYSYRVEKGKTGRMLAVLGFSE